LKFVAMRAMVVFAVSHVVAGSCYAVRTLWLPCRCPILSSHEPWRPFPIFRNSSALHSYSITSNFQALRHSVASGLYSEPKIRAWAAGWSGRGACSFGKAKDVYDRDDMRGCCMYGGCGCRCDHGAVTQYIQHTVVGHGTVQYRLGWAFIEALK
jgi:hypothetical protein